MTLEKILSQQVQSAVKALYNIDATESQIQLQKTRAEFEGNITLVVFPFVKAARKAPAQVAAEIGERLMADGSGLIAKYNAVQGFLNLSISDAFWVEQLKGIDTDENYGRQPDRHQLMMVEYSSPNTNKPLHLGHVRNNLLGYSIAQIQEANGWRVVKTNIVNDRGIHICKSMLAWLKFGNGETPESSGKKGDHLIGDYYVRFDKEYKAQIAELMAKGMDEETAKREAPLMQEAQEMLRKWEANDPEIRGLWDFTLIPGTPRTQEDGTTVIDRSDFITGSATMMIAEEDAKKKADSWEFMKWWAQPESQIRFGREIEALLGSSARYATANRDAFSSLSWSMDDIEVLNAQWDQTRGIREVPGGYFTGRHISNAIRRVLNEKEDSRETIIDYSIKIDEEITKKRKEFGMPVYEPAEGTAQ